MHGKGMTHIYVVYLDALLIQNFLLDGLAMQGVRVLLRVKGRNGNIRMLLGVLFGTLAGAAVFLLVHHYVIYLMLMRLVVQPMMVFLSLRPSEFREVIYGL